MPRPLGVFFFLADRLSDFLEQPLAAVPHHNRARTAFANSETAAAPGRGSLYPNRGGVRSAKAAGFPFSRAPTCISHKPSTERLHPYTISCTIASLATTVVHESGWRDPPLPTGRTVVKSNWVWCCLAPLFLFAVGVSGKSASSVVFAEGRPRIYLDISSEQAGELSLGKALEDLARCFEVMTGQALPRSGERPALFAAGAGAPVRFECEVISLADASPGATVNAQAGIVLSPTAAFSRNPFAEGGEKVGWTATWHRRRGVLTFALRVANAAYYGPGYGPFTFFRTEEEAARVSSRHPLGLALEMRGGDAPGIRGGYRLGGDTWVYTEWFDPATAGVDRQAPGVSDRNGAQAWAPGWTRTWSAGTAFYLTAYAPKGRVASVTIGSAQASREGRVLFASDFVSRFAGADGKLAVWGRYPAEGAVRFRAGSAVLSPKPGGWSTVGLRAGWEIPGQLEGLLPLRFEMRSFPPDVSRFDAQAVQGFEVDVDGKRILLRAHTSLGLRNAIYYLLDRWGCRWVMPGELGECIPEVEKLSLPSGVTRFSPYSDMAVEVAGRGGAISVWYDRNLAGWRNWLSGQHYWLYAIPPKTYAAEHPEWYSLIAGKRVPQQLCTTNPAVIARMIVAAKAFLGRSPNRVSFPMDPADNLDFCQCPSCTALDPPGKTRSGAPLMTNRVLRLANQVAAGIRDEFPDRYVAFYAYATHAAPPVGVKPAANVIVIVARSGHCLLHLNPTPSCPGSDFHDLVRRWRALTPNLYCYEYDPISWTGGLPCPTYLEMGRSLRTLFGELGVKGSYSDGGHASTSASTYINRYLARRIKIDPGRDPEDVLAEMCRAFFGPAAESMEGYYRGLARVNEHTHPGRRRVGGGSTFYARLFDRKMMTAARTFVDRATGQAAGHAPYDRRVAMVETSLRYLESYLAGVWRAEARDYGKAVAAFDRMAACIEEMERSGWIHAADARRRARTMRLKALAEHFPEELGFVTAWRLLGPFDNSARNADRERDPFEPPGDISGPVRTDTGALLHWIDYTSPGGFLNLEKALSGRPRDWALSYAYAGTVIKEPHPPRVQLRMDSFFPYRVYLNGKEIFYRPGLNADCPDRKIIDAVLEPGDNTLVFKLCQTALTSHSYPWGLYYRTVIEETRRDVAAFPARWRFRTDPEDAGMKQRWFEAGYADASWREIPVPGTWEGTTVGAYDGYAWYRVRFNCSPEAAGKKLALTLRGVDEQAWVYINGRFVGERTTVSTGKTPGEFWDEPFELAVPPGCVKPDGANVLTVRVHDSRFAGGIHGAVRLLLDE